MNENEFMLEDRIAKIRAINNQYDLLNNGYISFSGGKDSKITSDLIDIALPNNKIPRLFLNTGIEYSKMVKYVKRLAEKDDRIIIYNSSVNIRKMLNEYGYPFKSKQHSHNWSIYNNNRDEISKYIGMINKDNQLLYNFDFIHNLPNGVKTTIKYIYGIREKVVRVLDTDKPVNQYSKYYDEWGQKGYITEIGEIEKDTHDSVAERERERSIYKYQGLP